MKLKLLLGTLMLTAITANAQLASINENFNNFTSGNATFPQNGWSAKLADNPFPYPPAPMMIVTADANKAVQAYSGNNTSQPSYLITPKVVSNGHTLSFTATPITPYTSPATVQIGLASDAADMSTFLPVGTPITITAVGTVQNISVPIPASTGSFIVFKFLPTAAHTAIQIDDVVYNNTTVLGTSDVAKSSTKTQFAVTSDNAALQFVTKKDPKNVQIYSALGAKVSEGKLNNQRIDISKLQTGVYFVLIEEADGTATKSKFIKN